MAENVGESAPSEDGVYEMDSCALSPGCSVPKRGVKVKILDSMMKSRSRTLSLVGWLGRTQFSVSTAGFS